MSALRCSMLNDGFGGLITKLFDVMDRKVDQGALNVLDFTHRFVLEYLGLGLFGIVDKEYAYDINVKLND